MSDLLSPTTTTMDMPLHNEKENDVPPASAERTTTLDDVAAAKLKRTVDDELWLHTTTTTTTSPAMKKRKTTPPSTTTTTTQTTDDESSLLAALGTDDDVVLSNENPKGNGFETTPTTTTEHADSTPTPTSNQEALRLVADTSTSTTFIRSKEAVVSTPASSALSTITTTSPAQGILTTSSSTAAPFTTTTTSTSKETKETNKTTTTFPLSYKEGILRALQELGGNDAAPSSEATIRDYLIQARSQPLQQPRRVRSILAQLVQAKVVEVVDTSAQAQPQDSSSLLYYQLASDWKARLRAMADPQNQTQTTQRSKVTTWTVTPSWTERTIQVPPGKLGVHIGPRSNNDNDHDHGIFICSIQPTSPLEGHVLVGDCLVKIDGERLDGTITASDVATLLLHKSGQVRSLTFRRMEPSQEATNATALLAGMSDEERARHERARTLATTPSSSSTIQEKQAKDGRHPEQMVSFLEMTTVQKHSVLVHLIHQMNEVLLQGELKKQMLAYHYQDDHASGPDSSQQSLEFVSGPTRMIVSRVLSSLQVPVVASSCDDPEMVNLQKIKQVAHRTALKLQVTHNAMRQYGFLTNEPGQFMTKSLQQELHPPHHHHLAQMIFQYASTSTLLQFPNAKELSTKYCLYDKARKYLVETRAPLHFIISLMSRAEFRTAMVEYCTKQNCTEAAIQLATSYWNHYFALDRIHRAKNSKEKACVLSDYWNELLELVWNSWNVYCSLPDVVQWRTAVPGFAVALMGHHNNDFDKEILDLLLAQDFGALFRLHHARCAARMAAGAARPHNDNDSSSGQQHPNFSPVASPSTQQQEP